MKTSFTTFKEGLCAACHSGPMLNQTNQFLPIPPLVLLTPQDQADMVAHHEAAGTMG